MSISAAAYLGEVKVTKGTDFPHTLEIYRCENGMLIGIDSRWNGQVKDRQGSPLETTDVAVHCPYDTDTIHILDSEHITQSSGTSP